MHPFACPLCQSLPVNATVIASCLHVFCKNCLKQYQNKARHADICPECGCKYKRTKRTPEYEIKLREAFPEEYENRKDFLQVKLNSVDELDFLNERIARLSWLRTKLFKRVREDGDISKQAEEYFGTKRKYNIIYADPPWNYLNQIFNGSIKDKYDQMTDKDIHALPVEGLCHENAALFLWTTMPKIKVALEVIESWGFSYTTCFAAWSKIYPKTGEVKCGAGSYTRPNTELVLLGLKGDISKYRARNQCISNAFIPCPEKNPLLQDPLEGNTNRLLEDHPKIEDEFFDSIKKSRILVTPYVEKHSQKPLQIADWIVRFFGDLPRIELFGRSKMPGWDVFGNETDKYKRGREVDPHFEQLWKQRQDANSAFEVEFMRNLDDLWENRKLLEATLPDL